MQIQNDVTGYIAYYNEKKAEYEKSVTDYNTAEQKYLADPIFNVRPDISAVVARPPAPEDYTGIFMETKEVSMPLPANCVTPYGTNGGWGYLTAGTLNISTKNKSYGLASNEMGGKNIPKRLSTFD